MKKLSAWFCAGLCLIAVLLPLGVAVGDLPRCGEGEWALEWPWLLLPVLILTVAGVLVRLRCRPFWLRPGQLAAVLLTALI